MGRRSDCWLLKLAIFGILVLVSLQGINSEQPTESECRPYIEKALKEHHVDASTGDDDEGSQVSTEQENRSPTDELTDSQQDGSTEEGKSGETDDETNIESIETQEDGETGEKDDSVEGDTKEEDDDTQEGSVDGDTREDGDASVEGDTKEDDGSVEGDTNETADDSVEGDTQEDVSVEGDTKEDENESVEGDTKEEDNVQSDTKEDEEGDSGEDEASVEGDTQEEQDSVEGDTKEDGASVEGDTKEEGSEEGDDGSVEGDTKEEGSVEGDTEESVPADTLEEGDTKEDDSVQGDTKEDQSVEGDTKEDEDSVEGDTKEDEDTVEGDTEQAAESVEGDTQKAAGSVEGDTEEAADSVEGHTKEDADSVEGDTEEAADSVEGDTKEDADSVEGDTKEESVEGDTKEDKESVEGDTEEAADETTKADTKETEGDTKESQEGDTEEDTKEEVEVKDRKRRSVDAEPESDSGEGKTEEQDTTEDEDETQETASDEGSTPEEEELTKESVIPDNLRPRDHIATILKLNEDSEMESLLTKGIDNTLKTLKTIYDTAIKPLEMLYKYRELSNRHFGDPEIFSKPLILFMGPWSGGKSSTINYLLNNEFTPMSLRTGAEPSPAYFNILMYGKDEEILDGTQLAADWTFSGLQKFGQGLLDRLRGVKLNNKLLEKVNIVEIPGILEIRKQVQRLFPFNDACQWFIDRADIIFLVYDPAKLDVGPETEAILDQLKGREYQTRIILNKADQVKPEELMRVQGTLIWNISPLMSSQEPPVMYSTSLWSMPYESGAPTRLLHAQERAFLRDLREAMDKRIENKISSARRFAVRVRNHAKMVDCYLTTYYNHKTFFGNRKKISDDIIEYPQKYHIYEGLSTLTNISRYDLPDPDVYKDFFKINPLYDFTKLSETCTYFRGCPINKLDIAIAYDLPELVGKHKKSVEAAKEQIKKTNS